MHTAVLVHRDIKPGNALLALDGPPLIGFGIARMSGATALTATDVVIGTSGYLPPEHARARDEEVGPPSDVFSLGCLPAFAATGRPPFDGAWLPARPSARSTRSPRPGPARPAPASPSAPADGGAADTA